MHGATPLSDSTTLFRLWAPRASAVDLAVGGRTVPMTAGADGWFELTAPAGHGDRYGYHLDGGPLRPDPASRWLPDGVHEMAAVLDPATFAWTDSGFAAAPITTAVVYELHVGTFTPEGTFAAAIDHLDALVDLGITHVEVMPVNAFDGQHNWGYDGVAWWAVHEGYGGPGGLASFVDVCHARGLAVVLDVVHNHLGPSGNYLADFGPYLVEDAESTWGKIVNIDGPNSGAVREFILGSALAWLRDLHIDALRLDAVHALVDRSATHLLAELSDRVAVLSEAVGRPLQLIAETDRNDPQTIRPRALGGQGIDAQWADDLHHAIHGAVTGEADGYYADYADPLAAVAAAYERGLVYDGSRFSGFRGRVVGAPLPPDVSSRQLVACIQNHDQVGNRPAGDRLTTLVEPDLVRVAIALLCLAPHTPMLFMGEEYGETTPFQFFTDMPGEDLRQAIRDGRRREFEYFSSWAGEVPDPLAPATFARSKLDHSAAGTPEGQQRRALWRDLLALRRTEPALGNGRRDLVAVQRTGPVLVITRRPPAGAWPAAAVVATANLGTTPVAGPDGPLLLSTADPRYGGLQPPENGEVRARSVAVHRAPI
ncbi:malto-oligosyltrehalose trehalohydrolase [soil metagenome]